MHRLSGNLFISAQPTRFASLVLSVCGVILTFFFAPEKSLGDVIFSEGFESGVTGWTRSDMQPNCGDDRWNRETCRPYNGSYSLWCAGTGDMIPCQHYDCSQISYATRGWRTADFSDLVLSYRVFVNCADNNDCFKIYWKYQASDSWHEEVIWRRCGANPTWELHSMTWGTELPESLYVYFLFQSDASGQGEGVYLDDIKLEGTLIVNDPDIRIEPTSLIYPPASTLQTPRSETALLHLRNRDVEIPSITTTQLASALPNSLSFSRLILIYDHPVGLHEMEELRSRGVSVLGIIPSTGILITPPESGNLIGVSGLLGAEPVRMEDKMGRILSEKKSNDKSAMIGIVVDFFSDVSLDEIEAVAERFALIETRNDYVQTNTRIWTIRVSDLHQLGQEKAVRFLLTASDALLNNDPVYYCSGGRYMYGDALQYVVHDQGWDGPGQGSASLTYHFVNSTPDLPVADQRTEIVRGLNEWTRFVDVTWTETGTVGVNRSMDIQFVSGDHGDGDPFDGPGWNTVWAHCFYPAPPNPEPIGGDCHFDEAETWMIGANPDMFTVALHEAGHGLGLGHSLDPDAVMYEYIQGVYSGLHQDDINGIQSIYAPRTEGCFTIYNDATADLLVSGMSLRDNDTWVAGWSPSPPFTLQAGQQVEVCVNVNMDLVQGVEDDRLLVLSNDPDESPYPNAVLLYATEPPCSGNLLVNSVPEGASITIDDNSTGFITPHLFTLDCGTHTVELDAACYQHWTSDPVQIAGNGSITIDANLTQSLSSLTLAIPNGGEIWQAGTSQNVMWTSSCFSGSLAIKLTRNYPIGPWEVLTSGIAVTPNQWAWSVTGPASSTCRLALVSESNPTVADTSATSFAIAEPSSCILNGNLPMILNPGLCHVTGNITVPVGQTTTIMPGCTLMFDGHYSLLVEGTLHASGTESDSIVFTCDTIATPSGWGGIRFVGADNSSTLSHCVIENGRNRGIQTPPDYNGGGAFVFECSPVIEHSTFRRNSALNGGGLQASVSNVSVSYCLFEENHAWDGGGAHFDHSSPVVTDCRFIQNTAEQWGGGIMWQASSNGSLQGCTVNSNSASVAGGGIHIRESSNPTISTSSFSENSAVTLGGGIFTDLSNPTVLSCVIDRNISEDGAGVHAYYANPVLDNCIVYGNRANRWGGGMHINHASPELRHCTIVADSAIEGGGLFIWWDSVPTIQNTIIASCAGSGVHFETYFSGAIHSSDITDNYPQNFVHAGNTGLGESVTVNANGDSCDQFLNISSNPLFVNLGLGDFSLSDYSHCIGAGTDTNSVATDFVGNPRPDPTGSLPDIGAFENSLAEPIVLVCDLYGQLPLVLYPGLCHVTGDISVPFGQTTTIMPGCTLMFDGDYSLLINGVLNAIGSPQDSIFFTCDTTGGLRWDGIRFFGSGTDGSELCYSVVEFADRSPDSWDGGGGGIFCDGSSPAIIHSTVRFNSARTNGGGIACKDNSSPLVEDCHIHDNVARDGGGIMVFGSGSNPVISRCRIIGNVASQPGATGGGGLELDADCRPTVVNCLVADNTAPVGGGIYLHQVIDSARIEFCTIVGNSATSLQGGGIAVLSDKPTIRNSIIASSASGSGVFFESGVGSIDQISFSDISGNPDGAFENQPAGIGILVTVNSNGDSCDLNQNIVLNPLLAAAEVGDYRLTDSSPCIGAGSFLDATTVDLNGGNRPEPLGSMPDIGALENSRSNPYNPNPNPIGYWPLDGNGMDVSGNGNDLTSVEMTYTADRFGEAGGAGYFDGTSSYLTRETPSFSFSSGSSFSYSLWARLDSFSSDQYSPCTMILNGTLDPDNFVWSFATQQNLLRFGAARQQSSWYFADYGVDDLNIGRWYHFAGVYHENVLDLYIDGQLRASNIFGGQASAAVMPFSIGATHVAPNNTWGFFKGAIDEVKLFERALSDSDIIELAYKDCPSTPVPFVDDFNGSLDGCWTWAPSDPQIWDLTTGPGWLTAWTEPDLRYLMRNRPSTDFAMITRVEFLPELDYHSAGLALRRSDTELVVLRRHHDGPNGGQVVSLQTGTSCEADGYVPCTEDNVYLRMEVVGESVRSSWSPDGEVWSTIQTNSCDWIQSPEAEIGLCLSHGLNNPPSTEVQFDFFTLNCVIPSVSELLINSGSVRTTSQNITLNHSIFGNATEYIASEHADFTDAQWVAYSPAPGFVLSGGYGPKIVYFKTRNECGESETVSDAVILEQEPPAAIDDLVIKVSSNREDIELYWTAIPDVALYSIYSGMSADFLPSDTNRVATVSEPFFVDYGRVLSSSTRFYKVTSLVTPAGMVLVPFGGFEMGAAYQEWSMPIHFVNMPAFFMDRYEVTNKEYRAFCIDTDHAYPLDPSFSGMQDYFLNPLYDNYPVVNVSWIDAQEYANWIGKRLPTEAEWELAAKGNIDNRTWPWGEIWTEGNANAIGSSDGYAFTAPIGTYANGVSQSGCFDMSGNVWEWCSDWFSSTYYNESPYENPQGPSNGTLRVMRGGAWQNTQDDARCAWRDRNLPETRHFALGFRCAKTP